MSIYVGLEVPLQTSNHYKLVRNQLTDRFTRLKVSAEFMESPMVSIPLCFLGHLSDKSVEKLDVVRAFASFYPKQHVIINGMGSMPTWDNARSLWMNCRKTESLTTLQDMLQKCIQREGIPAEMKNFFPRITICRFANAANLKELSYGIPAGLMVSEVQAPNIVIYKADVVNPDQVTAIKVFPLS